MPSTNQTPNLGLNKWIDSDRPKRTDFVSDNVIIDTVLGTHINDTDVHLTSAEKARVSQPFKVSIAYGTGESSTEVSLDFEPSLVFVFKQDEPLDYYSGNTSYVNSAVVTQRGVSSGVSLSGTLLTLYQGNNPDLTRVYNNLNQQYAQYIIIAFR